MGQDDSRALTEQRIAEIDRTIPSPSERAAFIFNQLQREHPELTDWDLLCFAGEYIGIMSQVHRWLLEPAKRVVGLIYAAHYLNPETIDAQSSIRRVASQAEPRVEQPKQDSSGESEMRRTRPISTRIEFG